MAIVRTQEEFLSTFNVGDTVYWTQLYRNVPTTISEFVIAEITDHDTENPDQIGLFDYVGHPMIVLVHYRDQGDSYPRTIGSHTLPRYLRTKEYLDTILMTNRICTTTREEAEQGLATLKWLWFNDAEGLARQQEDDYLDDYLDESRRRYDMEYI